MTEAETKLLALIRERCYKEGDFVLSSGEHSKYYFDGKMAEMNSEGAALIGEVLYQRTQAVPFDAMGGLELGAIPLTTAAAFAYHKNGRSLEGFIVRNEAKKHGTKKIIEGMLRHGSRVIIVDDVVTTGKSVIQAVDAVRKAECEPVLVVVLVDRMGGAREAFAKMGIKYESVFTINDFKKP
jgi:orotate phosphoribosyltransferase